MSLGGRIPRDWALGYFTVYNPLAMDRDAGGRDGLERATRLGFALERAPNA